MIHNLTKQLRWAVLVLATHYTWAQRAMEPLGRGVVALPNGEGDVFVSWRLLADDPADVGFNVYRVDDGGEATKLNSEPLFGPTCYVDKSVPDRKGSIGYFVRSEERRVGKEGVSEGRYRWVAFH